MAQPVSGSEPHRADLEQDEGEDDDQAADHHGPIVADHSRDLE